MEITRLPIGEQAPSDADCIRIEEQADGKQKLTASALCGGEHDSESVSIVGGPVFATLQKAEEAGLAWAENVGVDHLYISTGTLAKPLQLTEIDLPL
jgi:hypothetical protein